MDVNTTVAKLGQAPRWLPCLSDAVCMAQIGFGDGRELSIVIQQPNMILKGGASTGSSSRLTSTAGTPSNLVYCSH
jgi:hypothetical protein